jgi:transcriptional regulator with XRE-family HTH domain
MPAPRERAELSEAIAAQIRAERSAARLTVEETAKRSGIPYATYRKLDDGRGTVDAEQLNRLCRDVYGITLREFFERVESRLAAGQGGSE